jgi:hypothetical protein
LPPLSERAKVQTIEEELEEKRRNNPFAQHLSNNDLSLSADAPNNAPGMSSSTQAAGSVVTAAADALKNASPVSPIAPQQQSVRAPSQSPFMISGTGSTGGSATTSRAKMQEEEQFAMFRLPFFRGRTPHNVGGKALPIVNGEVNVDNIGSIWDDGVKTFGDKRWV